jgi:hypothetical protein
LCLALSEKHVEMFTGRFDFEHWILRDDATIVFYFHVELIVRQDSAAEMKDFREAIRAKPVLDIAADMRLKDNRFVPPREAPAVDEVFHDVTDLGHMGMRWNGISIGQDKTRENVGMLFEDFSKSGEFHNRPIFLLENIVKAAGTARESHEWTRMGRGRELTADDTDEKD